MTALRTVLGLLANQVFPRECVCCGSILESKAEDWCDTCQQKLLQATSAPRCPRCGLAVGPYLADADGCPTCQDRRSPIAGVAHVGAYGGIVGELVRLYKYKQRQRLDRPLAVFLAAAIEGKPWRENLDALIPVPTTWRNRLTYRFRPADQLARHVGRQLQIPAIPLLHVRGKQHNQVGLPHDQRAANVRGVFRLDRHARIAGTNLCIVDDVSTSGATVREIARVLKRAGVARVYAATLAKTDPTDAHLHGA